MTQTDTGTKHAVYSESHAVIDHMREAVASGEQWFSALLGAVRAWPLAEEEVGERSYRYLVAGQAFDWLLLAERLTAEITDFVPEDELHDLLFYGRPPLETTDEELQEMLGAKYKAHLNFVYGVRVEAALQMAVGDEVRKEQHATQFSEKTGRTDDEVHLRIYGKPFAELAECFRAESGRSESEWLSLAGLSEWRYWLFQYRIKNSDPEKVASDTRKGLAALQGLERAAREKRRGSGDED